MKSHEIFQSHSYRIKIQEQEIWARLLEKYEVGDTKQVMKKLVQFYWDQHGRKHRLNQEDDTGDSKWGKVRRFTSFKSFRDMKLQFPNRKSSLMNLGSSFNFGGS